MEKWTLLSLVIMSTISSVYSQVVCYTDTQCVSGREINHAHPLTGVQGVVDTVSDCCQLKGGLSRRVLGDPPGPCTPCGQDVCSWCNVAPSIKFPSNSGDSAVNLLCQEQLPDVPEVAVSGVCANVTLTVEETPDPIPTSFSCNATVRRTYRAEDECGNTASRTQTITIREAGLPVFTYVPPDIVVECGTYVKNTDLTGGKAVAESGCGDPIDPVDVSFTDKIITDNLCNETIARTWTASSVCGKQVSARQHIHIQLTASPAIKIPGGDRDIFTCDTDLESHLRAIPAASLEKGGVCSYISFPSLSHSDSFTDGTLSGGVTSVTRNWTVSDICGNTASRTQLINIKRAANADVHVDFLGDVPDDASVLLDGTCANIPPRRNISALGVGFSEEKFSTDCPNVYNLTRTWTANDGCGNTISKTQIISVDYDAPPVFIDPLQTVEAFCFNIPSLDDAPIATGHCGMQVDVDLMNVTTINGSCPQEYVEVRTWRATDQCGMMSFLTQNVTVVPLSSGPNFTFIPPSLTVSCGTDWTDPGNTGGTAVATSICDHQVDIRMTDEVVSEDVCAVKIKRTWEAVDVCGQTSTRTQMITVRPESPYFVTVPPPVSVPCGVDWKDPANTGGDAVTVSPCGYYVTLESAYFVTTDDFCNTVIRKTWTATDQCGQVSTADQIIRVVIDQELTLRPFQNRTVKVCPEYDRDLSPSEFDDEAVVENMSPCLIQAYLTVQSSDAVVKSDPSQGTRLIRRSWEVVDICGNEGRREQYISVQMIERPELVLHPSKVEVTCTNTEDMTLLPVPELRPRYPSPRTWDIVNAMQLEDITPDHTYHHRCFGQTEQRTFQAYELTCGMNITLQQQVIAIDGATTTPSTTAPTTTTTTSTPTTTTTKPTTTTPSTTTATATAGTTTTITPTTATNTATTTLTTTTTTPIIATTTPTTTAPTSTTLSSSTSPSVLVDDPVQNVPSLPPNISLSELLDYLKSQEGAGVDGSGSQQGLPPSTASQGGDPDVISLPQPIVIQRPTATAPYRADKPINSPVNPALQPFSPRGPMAEPLNIVQAKPRESQTTGEVKSLAQTKQRMQTPSLFPYFGVNSAAIQSVTDENAAAGYNGPSSLFRQDLTMYLQHGSPSAPSGAVSKSIKWTSGSHRLRYGQGRQHHAQGTPPLLTPFWKYFLSPSR